MIGDSYKYFLTYGSDRIFLFESQFQFKSQTNCLSHFERGLSKGIFNLDHSKINLMLSVVGLWGFIGRTHPVELLRTLCASGCAIKCTFDSYYTGQLLNSYGSVIYYTKIDHTEYEVIKPILQLSLGDSLDQKISPFIMNQDRLVFGSFYTDFECDADIQFPKYCKLIERDICLPVGSIQRLLAQLFWMGFKITALQPRNEIFLAERDLLKNCLRGYSNEITLFYVAAKNQVSK